MTALTVQATSVPMQTPSTSQRSSPCDDAESDQERRGRDTHMKRITSSLSPKQTRNSSRPDRQRRRPARRAIRRNHGYDSDLSDDEESRGDSSSTSGRATPMDSLTAHAKSSSVTRDLDTFAFDSDEEGEQSRHLEQQDDWLRSKGKNVQDVRLVLDKSKKDGIIARQLLTEIGLDIHVRNANSGKGVSASLMPFDDVAASIASDAFSSYDVGKPAKRGHTATSPSTSPRLNCKARLSSPSFEQRALSPQTPRALSPLQFARKPSPTQGSDFLQRHHTRSHTVQLGSRPDLASLRRRSSAGLGGADSPIAMTKGDGSHTSKTTPLSRDRHLRSGGTTTVEALPWLRNLQSQSHRAQPTSTALELTATDSQFSLPEDDSAAAESAHHLSKQDRRLSGSLTSVCKATATAFCDRKFCNRHSARTPPVSLASGSLRRSLGGAQGRARSHSETQLDIQATLRASS